MKFLRLNPQPTITFEYNNERFQQSSRNNDSLLLLPHSLFLDSLVNAPSELGDTTTLSSSQNPDKFGGTLDMQDKSGGTGIESLDIAPYRPIWVALSVTLLITSPSAS